MWVNNIVKKNKFNLQIALLILTLLLVSLACSFVTNAIPETAIDGPTETPSAPHANPTAPVPNELPTTTTLPSQTPILSGLNLIEITFFQDDFENWIVSGLVVNNTNHAIDNIEVEIQALNPAGDSIYSEVVSASLYTIDPNETSPFKSMIWEELPDLDHFYGSIVGQSYAEVERPALEIRGVVFTISDDGSYTHISGEISNNGSEPEISNNGSEPAKINSLAVAIFDTGGNLVSADVSTDLVRYLYPGEIGPFRVSVATPATRRGEISDYALFTDAQLVSKEDNYEITFLEEHNYVDGEGDVHLIGELRNDSDLSLNISLVAGIYDEDNNVLDADTLSLALYSLAPGESLTYDFDGWEPLNDTRDLLDQVDTYTVQWDPYWTWKSSTDYITITTSDDSYEYDDFLQEMTFSGQIVNNTDHGVANAIIVITLRDKITGELVATGDGYIFDPIPVGGSAEYKVYLDIEIGLDDDLIYDPATNTFEFQTLDVIILAKGELP